MFESILWKVLTFFVISSLATPGIAATAQTSHNHGTR